METLSISATETYISNLCYNPLHVSLRCHLQASLIPQAEDIERFTVARTLAWVLVVEKEVRNNLMRVLGATTSHMPILGCLSDTLQTATHNAPSLARLRADRDGAFSRPRSHSLPASSQPHDHPLFVGKGISGCRDSAARQDTLGQFTGTVRTVFFPSY